MHRRYNRWWARFEQPDPYDGSYDLTDPQSFNRFNYVQNDPVNFVDPLGLDRFDDHLGPPPPPLEYLPQPPPGENDRIITNTSAPRSGGDSILGGDVHFRPEAPPLDGENPGGGGGGAGQERDVGPTRRNAELDRKAFFAKKLKECMESANATYKNKQTKSQEPLNAN